MNSDGFAVALGRGSIGGDLNKPATEIYYCGRKLGQCRCGECDGRCGPSDGCPCHSCKRLTLYGGPKLDDFVKCPRGHQMILSTRDSGWNCDGRREEGGCLGRGGTMNQARWRCVNESCDFDYCGECYSSRLAKILAKKFVVNCEGVKAKKSFDWFHTKTERHYCGRNVGRGKYANECRECDGKCGPSAGCQCRACFLLDNPQFLSLSSLRLNSRPIENKSPKVNPPVESTETCRSYRNGDFYTGTLRNGERDGFGTYHLCIGRSSSSPLYLEFPGEWIRDQMCRYLSYQNVWWECLSPISAPLEPLPEDITRPSFDINLLKSAKYLCLGEYFFVQLLNKIIRLENYEPSPLSTDPDAILVGTATGVWSEQSLAFTFQFSYLEVISGSIVHIPSGTVVLTFGTESDPSNENVPREAYQPLSVDQQIFQLSRY